MMVSLNYSAFVTQLSLILTRISHFMVSTQSFLLQIHMYRKLLYVFKHMTTHIQNTTTIQPIQCIYFPKPCMARIRNNYTSHAWSSIPIFTMYTKSRREILSPVLPTFKCCVQVCPSTPPPPRHTLHTSSIDQSSSLDKLRPCTMQGAQGRCLEK